VGSAERSAVTAERMMVFRILVSGYDWCDHHLCCMVLGQNNHSPGVPAYTNKGMDQVGQNVTFTRLALPANVTGQQPPHHHVMQPYDCVGKQKRNSVLAPHDDDGGGVQHGMIRSRCPPARRRKQENIIK
jgi:hypothetical protein